MTHMNLVNDLACHKSHGIDYQTPNIWKLSPHSSPEKVAGHGLVTVDFHQSEAAQIIISSTNNI